MNSHSFLPVSSERRDQILDAAAAAFARRGFHATTVANIAEEAGISHGLLYRYFSGKEGLVIAIVERTTGELAEAIEAAPSLDAALDALYASPATPGEERAEGALFVEILAEAVRNDSVADVVRQADERVTSALADRLQQAQRAREISRKLDPGAAAEVLMALADGFALRLSLADAEPPGLEKAVVRLLTRFLAR